MTIHVDSHNITYRGKLYTVLFHNNYPVQITDEAGRKLCRSHKKFTEIGRLAKLGETVFPYKWNLSLNLLVLLVLTAPSRSPRQPALGARSPPLVSRRSRRQPRS